MELINIMTIGIGFIVFLSVSLVCGRYIFLNKKRQTMILNFESYTAVLQYHMEKAYNLIHKDQILTYSLEATTLPDAEYNKASLDFIKLVQKLLGPTLVKEMIFLYGDFDTFAFTLAEYFNTRYDDDEIRKTSINDLMQDEGVQVEGSTYDMAGGIQGLPGGKT
jgi:hypothetical protein